MASDQVEYCGECQHYAKCKKLAEEGRLERCKIQESEVHHDDRSHAQESIS